jgi:hypothetical protein
MNKILSAVQRQLEIVEPIDLVRGVQTWWRLFSFDEKTGEIRKMVSQKNIIPYEGADVLARLFAGDITYKPGAMFFEFENTIGTPTPPAPTRDEGIDYYLNQLPLTPNRGYLRIPLVVSPAVTSSGANYAGNQVTFFALTAGTEGVHGVVPFSEAADSKVYGVGLAATPEPTQFTEDLLFSRSYTGFSPVPKESGYQIGAQYLIRFS